MKHASTIHDNTFVNRPPTPGRPDPREIIRQLRSVRGFASDNALAVAAGVPQPTLSRYLAGDHESMAIQSFQRIADVLEVTVSELLGEVPLSNSTRIRELTRLMQVLDEAEQQALIAAGQALAAGHAAKGRPS